MKRASCLVASSIVAFLALTTDALSMDLCRARVRVQDGTLLLDAWGVQGTLRWGSDEGKETRAIYNATDCITANQARSCELAAPGTPERITPPELCKIYLRDDVTACSAYLGECTPGRRPICPTDMVRVGSICIDEYEASVWGTPTGGTRYGEMSDDYPCRDDGQDCTNIYARSIRGVFPSGFVTWFQAQAACRNVGKRLPTNAEWQMAVAGTQTADCLSSAEGPTGSLEWCVSRWGAWDMVGNVAEWVEDWRAQSACGEWGWFADDTMCFGIEPYRNDVSAVLRGEMWTSGASPYAPFVGPYAIDASWSPIPNIPLFLPPSSFLFGFRCALDPAR